MGMAPASINLAVSPLSLHLTNDTPGVFVQIRRALRPDGLFLAAIPGSDTLQELRDVLDAAARPTAEQVRQTAAAIRARTPRRLAVDLEALVREDRER